MSTLVTMNVTWALDLVTSGHGLSIKCLPSALTTQTHDQYHVSLLCYAWKLLIWNRGVRSHQQYFYGDWGYRYDLKNTVLGFGIG